MMSEVQGQETTADDKEVIPFHKYVAICMVDTLREQSQRAATQSWSEGVVDGTVAVRTLVMALVTCVRAGLKYPSAIPVLMRESIPDLPTSRVVVQGLLTARATHGQGRQSIELDMYEIAASASGYQLLALTDEGAQVPLLDVFNMVSACGCLGLTLVAVDENEARNVIAEILSASRSIEEEGSIKFTDSLLQSYQDKLHIKLV